MRSDFSLKRQNDVCMAITYNSKKSKDQPVEVVNPARGQLNSENEYFPVPVRA